MTREQQALWLEQKGQTFVVDGALNTGAPEAVKHGTLMLGTQFSDDDYLALREVGTLKLPAEALPPEVIAQDMEALKNRNADLEAQLAQLLSQQGKGKKSGGDESPQV